MDSFFKGVKQGVKDIADGTIKDEQLEKEKQKQLKDSKQNQERVEGIKTELKDFLGSTEEILYVHSFIVDRMAITNKKLIYIDTKIAKNKTYHMIPFNKVTAYSILNPTGLSTKGRLQIFTGGDEPSISIESVMDKGMKEFCKILADNI